MFHLMPLDQYDYMTGMADLGGYPVKKQLEVPHPKEVEKGNTFQLIRKLNEWAEAERQQNPTGYKKKNISLREQDFSIL